MKSILKVMLFLLPSLLAGQHQMRQKRDSLTRQLQMDSAHIFRVTIARPYLKAENRNSYLANESVGFLGVMGGVTLYNRHIVSAGYYFLDKASRSLLSLEDNNGKQQFTKLSYVDFSYQYILFNYRYVQLNAPLEIGFGKYEAQTSDNLNQNIKYLTGNLIPFGWGLQLILKPLKWVGVSASGGYRQVKHDGIKLSLNGWYYSYGLWVDARYILRNVNYWSHKKRYHRQMLKYKG